MPPPPHSSRQRYRAFLKSPARKGIDDKTSTNVDAPQPPRAEKKTRRRAYLRNYIDWLRPYRGTLVFLFTLAAFAAALDMAWPLAIKRIIDGVIAAHGDAALRAAHLDRYGLIIVGVLVLKQAIDSTRNYRTAALNATVLFHLRRRLYARFLDLPLGQLGEMKSGGIVSRLSSDVDAVSGLMQQAIISPAVATLRICLTGAVLLVLSWRLAVGALLLMPPLALISLLWLRRVRPIYRATQKDRVDVDGRVSETFSGIRVVRSFRREKREQLRYANANHTIIRKTLFAQRLELVLDAMWGLLLPAISVVVVWYGGHLALENPPRAQIGDIFAFQIYAALLIQPVWQIVASISQTQRSLAAMERVFEILQSPPDKPDAPGAVDAPRRVEQIEFENVNFAYRPGTPVLENFTLNVPGGATVALVGPSGAGKTTLTDLVARFHDPTTGAIRLNGTDLRHLKLASYRSLLAIVQQDTFLFDGTVSENIAYGLTAATDAQIQDAAQRANAHEFIKNLPEQYQTLIGERGFKLSGGQRQRLSIARAVLANPQILILDEATSNLDTESEQLIQSSLSELFKNRTTFVIAHRLSTVTHADLIVALDHGHIREVGRHDELMAKNGFYAAMVLRQQQTLMATT